MTGLAAEPEVAVSFKITRAPGVHADHDPGDECEMQDDGVTCRRIERMMAGG